MVPPQVMLACYDGQGAFYKPHMDSQVSDAPARQQLRGSVALQFDVEMSEHSQHVVVLWG